MNVKNIIKIVTGIIIVPIGLISSTLWPWWSQAALPLKILTAPLVLPLVGFSYVMSPWWDNY